MDTTLTKWKKDLNRHPLLLTGIRGAGKTTTVLHFANDSYKNVLYLNLENEESKEFVQEATFSCTCTEKDFIRFVDEYASNCPNIFTKEGMSLTNDKDSILILDEIQNDSTVISFSHWFAKMFNSDLIIISSALYKCGKDEITLRYAERARMETMSFKEFQGVAKKLLDRNLKNCDLENLTKEEKEKEEVYANPDPYSILRLYCTVGGFPAVSKAIYLRQEWTTALAQVIDNLEKDLTDTKRQRLHARYLLKFLLNFVIQTRSTGTEQIKDLAKEINKMLEPLASITELEVYLLIERLKDLGILRLIVWEKKASKTHKDENKPKEINNYTLCFSDLGFITAAGFNTALNFLPDLNLISDVKFKFVLDFLDGLWPHADAVNGNNNIIIENYVYKAFLSNITTIDDRITIQFSEDCEEDCEADFKSNTSEITTASSDHVTEENIDKEVCFSQDTSSQGGRCFSLVIKDIPNLITKEIKIDVDSWSYLCNGEWIQLQNLEDTIITSLRYEKEDQNDDNVILEEINNLFD